MITKKTNNLFVSYYLQELQESIDECKIYLCVCDEETQTYYSSRLKWCVELQERIKILYQSCFIHEDKTKHQKASYNAYNIYYKLVWYYDILKNPYKKAWVKEMITYFETKDNE